MSWLRMISILKTMNHKMEIILWAMIILQNLTPQDIFEIVRNRLRDSIDVVVLILQN